MWFWVRVCYLPVPALMLEPVGVFGALGRGFRLTRQPVLAHFGIALLTVLIAQVAGQHARPAGLASPASCCWPPPRVQQYALLGLVLSQAVERGGRRGVRAPRSPPRSPALQYLDQRMRKEAYDVELMAQAGILTRA